MASFPDAGAVARLRAAVGPHVRLGINCLVMLRAAIAVRLGRDR